MTAEYIAAGIVGTLVLGLLISYNRFVSQRNLVENSWTNVDTELRRRYDLIPNLVQTVKGYAAHERAVLEEVTRARAAAVAQTGPPPTHQEAENALAQGVRKLLALAEGYPDLKASTNFLALQNELAYTEDRIQAARRFYNSNVAEYDRRLEAFPSILVARMFGFKPVPFFEIEPAVRPAAERAPTVG